MEAATSEIRGYQELSRRVCDEYLQVPGLRLTLAQAARLWSVDAGACRRVLDGLVDEAFLRCEDGCYMRADCDSASF